MIEHFSSPKPIEKTGWLSIRDYPRMGNPVRIRVADVYLPNCLAGDIVQFNFGIEATNMQYYAVEFTGKIVLTEDSSGINGTAVSQERGYNISPQVDQYGEVFHGLHHGVAERAGSCVIPSDGDYYLAAIYYAGGSSFTQSSESLKLESGYGDFSAIRFRS
jgi:hypothetical protein